MLQRKGRTIHDGDTALDNDAREGWVTKLGSTAACLSALKPVPVLSATAAKAREEVNDIARSYWRGSSADRHEIASKLHSQRRHREVSTEGASCSDSAHGRTEVLSLGVVSVWCCGVLMPFVSLCCLGKSY